MLYLPGLFTSRGSQASHLRSNIPSGDNSILVASVTAIKQGRTLNFSCWNPINILHGRIYHTILAFIRRERFRATYLYVNVHDADFSKQSSIWFHKCYQGLLRSVLTALSKAL